MSQHVFSTALADGRPVEIVLGWDPPLDAFFLTVTIAGQVAYSTLEEEDAFSKELSFIREKLDEMGLSVPEELYTEAELDRRFGDGVRRETHR